MRLAALRFCFFGVVVPSFFKHAGIILRDNEDEGPGSMDSLSPETTPIGPEPMTELKK